MGPISAQANFQANGLVFGGKVKTPHGTTARSKFVQPDGDAGFRVFTFPLDGDVMKVMEDITDGTSVTIGFDRRQGGLDVLIPLDLHVAEAMIAADGSIKRRRSGEMLFQFLECVTDVSRQVQDQLTPR